MTAIYARQSVDKKESVSIETQIEYCKNELRGDIFEVYEDKGFSGKNTKRPAFQKLMQDVEKGKIKRIIVYRIDRFSRNLSDFAGTYEFLEKKNVELISWSERFDTGSPIGKAMLGIIMIFAQMERETTVERVKDNYYKRGELGLFVGAGIHYGFKTESTMHNGFKTKILVQIPKEIKIIEQIYDMYLKVKSRCDVLEWLNKSKATGKTHSVTFVKGILRNPIYVKSNKKVLKYLQNKGAKIANAADAVDGHGIFLYGFGKSKPVHERDMTGGLIQVALHDGVISAEKWLTVQRKLDADFHPRNSGKENLTWLTGIIRCEYCQMHVSNTGNFGYLTCGGRKKKLCKLRKPFPKCGVVENFVEKELLDFMRIFPYKSEEKRAKNSDKIFELELKQSAVERDIDLLFDTLTSIENLLNHSAIENFKEKIERLCQEKEQLIKEISNLSDEISSSDTSIENIKIYCDKWSELSIFEKNTIARMFIKNVFLKDDEIRIVFIL